MRPGGFAVIQARVDSAIASLESLDSSDPRAAMAARAALAAQLRDSAAHARRLLANLEDTLAAGRPDDALMYFASLATTLAERTDEACAPLVPAPRIALAAAR